MHDEDRNPTELPHIEERVGLDLTEFRLRSRSEIARVLRDLIRANELLTAYYSKHEFLLTTLLGVEPDNDRLYVDVSTDEAVNRRVLASSGLVFVGRHHQVRVQFTASQATATSFQNGPAFAVPFPDTMLRVQRREFYRLVTPLVARPRCHFTTDDGSRVSVTVLDISLGGIGIIDPDPAREDLWEPGRIIKNCQVEIPQGHIVGDMEVRNRYPVTLPNGEVQMHIGCRFLHLDPRMNVELQRYIQRVELARRRLSRD
jgi:c-di-GMP-binding flagellar brake protein YcgR